MYYIDKIKELRKKHKYSQKDMAELLQTTQQQYSKYENLQQELPIRHLITICNHFNISADWLIGLEMPKPNIFITGTAGAGKTNTLKTLLAEERKEEADESGFNNSSS